MNTQKYYRYESYTVGVGYNPETETCSGHRVKIILRIYDVTKITPKGVVLSVYGERKFVLNSAIKQYACATTELAKASFIARKKKQISILSRCISDAKEAITLITDDLI